MTLQALSGERLIKRVHVKVYLPNEPFPRHKHVVADVGFGFSEENIQEMLDSYEKDLKQRFPEITFACRQIGRGEYNYVPIKELTQ